MGGVGTDVAKEASEIVLTDDHFATISAAAEEGRFAFANIQKAAVFLVSSGLGELLSILGGLLLGLPLPLLPAQILWLNVVTNGVQDVALAVEPGEEDEFRRPPRDPVEGIITARLLERVVVAGVVMAAGTLAVFLLEGGARSERLGYAQVAALSTMVAFQVFHVGNCRSHRRSAFTLSPLSNPFLLFGVAAAVLLHFGAMHWGPTQRLIGLEPLTPETWARIVVVALSIVVAIELHKLVRPHGTPHPVGGPR
jgi:Ca2+-transporting ATPase